MNVNNNNNIELNSVNNKLEFKSTQKSIDNITQKLFGQDVFHVDSKKDKNQLFKIGENSQEDIMKAATEEPSEFVRGALTALGNTATSKDLSELDESGYQLEDDKVDTVVTVTDKIQIYLATHCKDYEVTGDISAEVIEKVAGNTPMAAEIANKLNESNLPLTKDNVTESMEAFDMAKKLQPISDGAAKYMINNGLSPSIENIYKAEFSGLSVEGGTYGAGFFSEGAGYYGKTTDAFQWNNLKEQMGNVIESAGLEVNEDTLSDSKWLMENHIPLTKDTLKQYETLKNLTLPASDEDVLNSIIQTIEEGKRPLQAPLTNEGNFAQRAQDAYQVVQMATDDNIKNVIENNLPVTIYNIKEAQKNQTTGVEGNNTTNYSSNETMAQSSIVATEDNISFIKAKRQLEEIRLQMTTEANYKLLKQGISIETSDLENIINELKASEDTYYKQLLGSENIDKTQENIDALKDITTKIAEVRYVPNAVIAKVISGETPNTINGIHTTGTALKSTYEAAGQSYETLMTKPRSDMGDTIAKAFQNVDDILKDLGLEITESNQRAVRILGYNSMELSAENINAVKTVDAAVNQTISNLTPQVVLNMVREGFNPLDTSMKELNHKIDTIKEQIGEKNSQERYSEFLWRLEKNNEITSQEREAFIGMYRLLNQVEKTDGEVVGALVNQNADITLNNLLTGVRTIKNKGINVKVDDNFGELKSLTFQASSISDQIKVGFNQTEQQNLESADYYNSLIDKALKEMSPDKLSKVFEEGNLKDMSLEKFADELAKQNDNEGITKEYYEEQLKTIQKASQVEGNVIRLLSDFDQPVTISNILAAESMINKRGSMFKKLLDGDGNNSELTDAVEHIADSLTSKEDMQEAYEELQNKAINSINKQSESADVTSIDLKELKLVSNEIRLATNLSKEEKYEIPVKIGDEITSINLTVIRGTDLGKVSITMENESIGKAVAEFTLKGEDAFGYIATDNEKGLSLLKENEDQMNEQLIDSNITLKKVDYLTSKTLDVNHWKEESKDSKETNESNTKDLYSLAKAFVFSMQKAGLKY